MKRIQNVTLDEAYKLLKVNSFVVWVVSGNYMNTKSLEKDVETHVFMGVNIFLLSLVVKRNGVKTMASRTENVDCWASFITEYPQLFDDEIRGDTLVIP